jgi:hypothetical protein
MALDGVAERLVRDTAIECAGRLDGTIFTVMDTCGGAETPYFKRYRLACNFVMADVGDIINAMVRRHPELDPSKEEWVAVAVQRREAAPPPAGLQGQALVQAEVGIVVEHMRQLRDQDHEGVLTAAFEDFDEHLPKLMAALEDWPPRP